MSGKYETVFRALKGVMARHAKVLVVRADTETIYTLVGRRPSPYPQHKGQPMWFGEVRLGKAYVSYHLMPLYMNPWLEKKIPAELKKRMQGKTCFNFTKEPAPELLKELDDLTMSAIADWAAKFLL
jgi:hypothetical protein